MKTSLLTSLAVLLLSVHSITATVYEIPTPDGALLHTDIDEPPFTPGDKKLPFILERSPYGQDAEELIALVFAEALGYVGGRKDMRGTHDSTGNFSLWHDSAQDLDTTIKYLEKLPWWNGEIFTTGASADSIDEYATVAIPQPALRGQVDIFCTTKGWETFYIGGAYREALIEGWLHGTVPTQADDLISLVKSQEQPGQPWWQPVNGTNFYQNVAFPSLHWAGWYDIFQNGNLAAYEGFKWQSSLPGQAKLVIDPLGHCQAGADYFTHDTLFGRVLLPFLMALDFMADNSVTNRSFPNPPEGVGNVTMYVMGAEETGSPGQYWTTIPDFVVPNPTNYYMHADGTLQTTPSTSTTDKVSYIYNPANPVPTIGGDNLLIACGPLDQRPLENRPDVQIYTSAPLTSAVALSGPVMATLYVSTNVTDTDMVVKLIDVYPTNSNDKKMANSSTLVLDGVTRMKWRKFPATDLPQLLSGNPTDVYEVSVFLWNTTYIFAPGHSIRVHITSSNFPRFRPNLNTGLPINLTDQVNKTAATTVYLNSKNPSSITLPLVDAATQLPPFPVEEAVQKMAARHEVNWKLRLKQRHGADYEPTETFLEWLTRKAEIIGNNFRKRLMKVYGQ